jgi:hypothetical protein
MLLDVLLIALLGISGFILYAKNRANSKPDHTTKRIGSKTTSPNITFLNDSDASSTLNTYLNTLKNANRTSENIFSGSTNSDNSATNHEESLAFLSQIPRERLEELRALLSGQVSNQTNCLDTNQEIAFKQSRIKINDNGEYFNAFLSEIIEDNRDRTGERRTYSVWDCGCSMKHNKLGGVCDFGHTVCSKHLRWCHRGQHRACVLDSVKLRDGSYACLMHSGLMYLRTYPALKLQVLKRFFSRIQYKRETNI